jgi:nicotinate-nucleotide adenylyltransferase
MAPTSALDPSDTARRRIGLFGGSFDPVHFGHLHAARAARERFGLDRVVFVPAAQSPYKPGRAPAPAADRLRMVELAIAGERGFEASDLELRRPGPSYTIDTVRALPSALGEPEACEIYLVMGSDNLPGLAGWRDVRALLARVQPVVVHREGEPEARFEALRRELGDELGAKVERGYLRLPPVESSSTDLRAALPGLAGDAPLVPPAVLAYIRARGLYGARR